MATKLSSSESTSKAYSCTVESFVHIAVAIQAAAAASAMPVSAPAPRRLAGLAAQLT
eukprot:SAG22_NODE_10735_length_518_cov_1.231504_1_plen_56_part_01